MNALLQILLSSLDGYKTYIAAIGAFGLALTQFSNGDATGAYQSLIFALSLVGLRHAVEKKNTE